MESTETLDPGETMSQQVAEIGHNSVSYDEMIQEDPGVVFREEGALDGLVAELKKRIEHTPVNLSTKAGRSNVASLAAGIVKLKTAIDKTGKGLNEERRAAINAVDSIRRDAREKLDGLRDLARKPLTDWEAAEHAFGLAVGELIDRLDNATLFPAGHTAQDIADRRSEILAIDITSETYRDTVDSLEKQRTAVADVLEQAHQRQLENEAQQAELERLRAEETERQKREQEQRQREAIEVQAAEKAAAEERRKAQAEIDAHKAESERLQKAAERKAHEEERARREQLRRQADDRHREYVMELAAKAMTELAGISTDKSMAVVRAIANGKVPHVSIGF